MSAEQVDRRPRYFKDAPPQNFARGLISVEIPELEKQGWVRESGKVRDIWKNEEKGIRVMVTTDRQSAYDRIVGTIPGKGQVLNLLSAFWFENTQSIVPNHMIAVPHPNVLIARQAEATLPVEVVLRRYMARSSTSTSVYYNYAEKGRREIYGIPFPDGLRANEEFPMGTIITLTTKAETGHDEELTNEQAKKLVDSEFGNGTLDETKEKASALFNCAYNYCKARGLLLVDTKYEFGIDKEGKLMLIDEVHTPDSSRFWLAKTYRERFEAGENPEASDKEILRRYLSERGFRGEGEVPVIDPEVIDQMDIAYGTLFEMITGKDLPDPVIDREGIKTAVLQALSSL